MTVTHRPRKASSSLRSSWRALVHDHDVEFIGCELGGVQVDHVDWGKLEDWLMTADTSELIGFCGPIGAGISFERVGSELKYKDLPSAHRDLFERVFKARERDILLYIDTGAVSSEIPTAGNLAKKAQRLIRPSEG
jgi:hypothetical protein